MDLALILLIVLVGVSAIIYAGFSQKGSKPKSGDTGGDTGAPATGGRPDNDSTDGSATKG